MTAVTAPPKGTALGRARDPLPHGVIGASPAMHRVFRLIGKVAKTDSTVLIVGESGTGKELVARSIHLQSRRSEGPFVPVNVGAIPEALVESELFGYARGAFTGAAAERRGLVEEAEGGTLFLDEIGDMPASAQVKLLRTLERSEVRRLGDNATRIVDVRVVAATHRDLVAEVASGRFREDLYYRLNVVMIELPPLRDRREDVGLLASYFLEQAAARNGRGRMEFSPEARNALERYDWPGNVRELENAVEHAVTVGEGTTILPSDLPAVVTAPRLLPRDAGVGAAAPARPVTPRRAAVPGAVGEERDDWSLADVEREHIVRVLRRHGGNSTSAAKQLGISRTTLWRKLREYGISRTDTR